MRSVKNSHTVYFKVTAHIKYDDKGSLTAAIKDIQENLHHYMNCEGDHNYSTRIEGARMVSERKEKKIIKVVKRVVDEKREWECE